MVAAYQSGFSVGEQSRREPSERTSSNCVTWQPKVPAMWWFLPWMSLAMAPPRVTYFVPGVTGRKNPRGTAKSRIWARVMPASAVSRPVSGSKSIRRFMPVVSEQVAVLEEADVAVAAAHADGERAVVQARRDGRKVALPVERDDVRPVGGVATPGFEGGFVAA